MTGQRTEWEPVEENGSIVPLHGEDLVGLVRAVLEKDALLTMRVSGPSMAPWIRSGDTVTISPLHELPLRLGDVVACVVPGREGLVVHRLIGRNGSAHCVRGDAAAQADGWVEEQDILGRVIRVESGGKLRRLGTRPERWVLATLSRAGLPHRLARVLVVLRRRDRTWP